MSEDLGEGECDYGANFGDARRNAKQTPTRREQVSIDGSGAKLSPRPKSGIIGA